MRTATNRRSRALALLGLLAVVAAGCHLVFLGEVFPSTNQYAQVHNAAVDNGVLLVGYGDNTNTYDSSSTTFRALDDAGNEIDSRFSSKNIRGIAPIPGDSGTAWYALAKKTGSNDGYLRRYYMSGSNLFKGSSFPLNYDSVSESLDVDSIVLCDIAAGIVNGKEQIWVAFDEFATYGYKPNVAVVERDGDWFGAPARVVELKNYPLIGPYRNNPDCTDNSIAYDSAYEVLYSTHQYGSIPEYYLRADNGSSSPWVFIASHWASSGNGWIGEPIDVEAHEGHVAVARRNHDLEYYYVAAGQINTLDAEHADPRALAVDRTYPARLKSLSNQDRSISTYTVDD